MRPQYKAWVWTWLASCAHLECHFQVNAIGKNGPIMISI